MVAFSQDRDDPITLIISSLSGCVESGDIVHDIIKFIRPRARAIGSGCVASAEALIFAVAKKEYRYFLLIFGFLHQTSDSIGGQTIGMQVQA